MADPALIVIEGPNAVGKTTLAHRLADAISEIPLACEVIAFPGNTPGTLGNLVKQVHKDPATFDVQDIAPTSLQLLHIAAHIDAIEKRVRPLLEDGTSIVLDRFWWSTVIYGRISGVRRKALDEMIRIEKQYWGPLVPDKLFLIDRDAPLSSQVDSARWGQIRREYIRFAESNAHDCPVKIISNDASIEDTTARLISSVFPVLPESP